MDVMLEGEQAYLIGGPYHRRTVTKATRYDLLMAVDTRRGFMQAVYLRDGVTKDGRAKFRYRPQG